MAPFATLTLQETYARTWHKLSARVVEGNENTPGDAYVNTLKSGFGWDALAADAYGAWRKRVLPAKFSTRFGLFTAADARRLTFQCRLNNYVLCVNGDGDAMRYYPNGSAKATLAAFAGAWSGHTRGLTIDRSGHAKESVGDGCCDPVADLTFALSSPKGTDTIATAKAVVTSEIIHDQADFSASSPAPRVGETGVVRLKNGVIDEPFMNTNYCNYDAQLVGTCGA